MNEYEQLIVWFIYIHKQYHLKLANKLIKKLD